MRRATGTRLEFRRGLAFNAHQDHQLYVFQRNVLENCPPQIVQQANEIRVYLAQQLGQIRRKKEEEKVFRFHRLQQKKDKVKFKKVNQTIKQLNQYDQCFEGNTNG